MWAIVAAPLMIGSDPRALTPSTFAMLGNPQRDRGRPGPARHPGDRDRSKGSAQVWVKPLGGGARAVALLNTGSAPVRITTSARAMRMTRGRRYRVETCGPTVVDDDGHDQRSRGATCRGALPRHAPLSERVILHRAIAHQGPGDPGLYCMPRSRKVTISPGPTSTSPPSAAEPPDSSRRTRSTDTGPSTRAVVARAPGLNARSTSPSPSSAPFRQENTTSPSSRERRGERDR